MIRKTRLQGSVLAGLVAIAPMLVTGGFLHFAAAQDAPPSQAARKPIEAKKPDSSPYPDQKFPNCVYPHSGLRQG